jgi:hypothetical protein
VPAPSGPPKPAAGGKLISEEERAVGGVALSVYARYIKSLGGWHTGLILLTLYVIDQASNVLANWWLELWSRESSSNASRGVALLPGPVRGARVSQRAARVWARLLHGVGRSSTRRARCTRRCSTA